MAKMGGSLVSVGLGVAGLAAVACGSAGGEVANEEASGTISEAFTWATRYDNSAAPVRTQVKFCRSGFGPAPRTVDCAVDPGFALVGGGARALWSSAGAMLTQSQPLNDGFTWRARSVDHTYSEPHDLEVYAIGLRLEGVNARVLRSMMSTAGTAAPSDAITSSAPGWIVSGGGSVTTTPLPGKMLTRSRHDPLGWSVAGKPLNQATPAGVGIAMRLIPTGIVEGFGAIDLWRRVGPTNFVTTGVGTSVDSMLTGWAIVAYGGEATASSGPGRFQFGMGPDGMILNRARAESKDHAVVSGGNTTVYYNAMRRVPNSHGLCNVGNKLATHMDPCVASICAVDSFCCNTGWDALCVSKVQSVCGRSCADYTCSTPVFTPNFWTSNGRLTANACYDYANNRARPAGGWPAVPGQNAGFSLTPANTNVENVTEAALADGLTLSSETGVCPERRTKIALAIKPAGPPPPPPAIPTDLADYHWYRQDANGLWSHKMGTSAPSTLDAHGAVITNPRLAARGKHSIFGGYFCTCSSSSEGQGHAVIGP
jgi:hypothetical protein